MRVVLDTNVIISAAISPASPPAQIHLAWNEGRFELLVSPDLLAEYRRALGYERVRERHRKSDDELDALVLDYELAGVVVEPEEELDIVTADPDDNRVLECAVAGTASHIVSGDRHLLTMGEYEEIPILDPRAFLTLLEDEAPEEHPETTEER